MSASIVSSGRAVHSDRSEHRDILLFAFGIKFIGGRVLRCRERIGDKCCVSPSQAGLVDSQLRAHGLFSLSG